jgi:hypothetical protein
MDLAEDQTRGLRRARFLLFAQDLARVPAFSASILQDEKP